MKLVRVLACLSMAVAAFAAGSHYDIDFRSPVVVSGTELRPGSYRIELSGDKALIEGGNQKVECSVKVEEGGQKYKDTTVRYTNVEGKNRIAEIRLGGTKTKVIFSN